jgi:glycine oxidase
VNPSGGDVIVIGAGLIGLTIAFELAERGAGVSIYDRGEPGRGASWAGAGMLAPYTEGLRKEPLLALCAASLQQYPAFVERVIAASALDPRLRLEGVVHAAFDDAEFEALRRHARALEKRSVSCRILDRAALLAAEPWLSATAVGGLAIDCEGCVDNRRLGRSLVAACEARRVRVRNSSAIKVECDGRRVLGVRTDLGFIPAGAVVNACGAWAAALPGVPASCVPPVEPVKGQMLALAVPIGLVRRPTWIPGAYLVPRDDGRLLVGATSEYAGFDERVTAQAVHQLLHAGLAAAPSLAAFSLTETWAGLRPGTSDGMPCLGPTPVDGLFLATGHYRNGILLAPVTARLIADSIERRPVPELEDFLLARFGTEDARSNRISHA